MGGRLAGAAIETPKGEHLVKLSTFWVAPWARRRGVGSQLLGRLVLRWQQADLESAWVTMGLYESDDLMGLMVPHGFEAIGLALDRYHQGRAELVLGWHADRFGAHVAPRQVLPA
jgi:ribosomal protein S18 acetylase RimI-like enzyme